jgi:thioredoxin reductase (NADPH)
MAEQTGTQVLIHAHALHPEARRMLLVPFGDTSADEELIRAMTLGQIDTFVSKPWASPEEWLYPAIGEILSEWARMHLPCFEAIRVVGPRWSTEAHLLRDHLSRTPVPYGYYPADSAEGRRLLQEFNLDATRLPAFILHDGRVFVQPAWTEVAAAMGARTCPACRQADVTIIGAGPAALAAAVYGASEGLRAVILDADAVGGQAGTSSKIRNYLGFPRGISGHDLAVRAFRQAVLFGAEVVVMNRVTGLRVEGDRHIVTCADGSEIMSRAVVIATGVAYRRLAIPAIEALRGVGVFYGAAVSEAPAVKGQHVFVVGAGNSASQTALHLARYAAQVTILVRSDSLAKSMSEYLITEIAATTNIDVRLTTEVVGAHGTGQLSGLELRNCATGETETVPAAALFILIGAEPQTAWLPDAIARDARGFILTGRDLLRDGQLPGGWPLERPPALLETSLPGFFAVGDVRQRSMKRVASAVGEGATAISLIHEYLQEHSRI